MSEFEIKYSGLGFTYDATKVIETLLETQIPNDKIIEILASIKAHYEEDGKQISEKEWNFVIQYNRL